MEAYPLTWPAGWKRTLHFQRVPSRFGSKGYGTSKTRLTIAEGTSRVRVALWKMEGVKAESVIISSNLAVRNDGLPRSGQREPEDCGVAVYWSTGNAARCIAVDQYDRVADNLGAIAATLEAMRAIERHGGAAILNRAFAGFTALPAPEQHCWKVLEIPPGSGAQDIEEAFRKLARLHHPDRGGSPEKMTMLNLARSAALNIVNGSA